MRHILWTPWDTGERCGGSGFLSASAGSVVACFYSRLRPGRIPPLLVLGHLARARARCDGRRRSTSSVGGRSIAIAEIPLPTAVVLTASRRVLVSPGPLGAPSPVPELSAVVAVRVLLPCSTICWPGVRAVTLPAIVEDAHEERLAAVEAGNLVELDLDRPTSPCHPAGEADWTTTGANGRLYSSRGRASALCVDCPVARL